MDLKPDELYKLPKHLLQYMLWRKKWAMTARHKQVPPSDDSWTEYGMLFGRGAGKTLAGAQWLSNEAISDPQRLPVAVIAPTLNDVRHTCFEGPAGILAVVPEDLIHDYNRTNLIITLVDLQNPGRAGASIRGFSAEEPERLRGPQFSRLWADEIASWTKDEETWDMAMMGLRLGDHPKGFWTTTPKPKEFIRKLVEPKAKRIVVRGSTYENRDHLPDSFFDQLKQYEGTQLGRQELDGELIDAEEGGVINRSWFKLWPSKESLPPFEWVVMSLDTAYTEKTWDKRKQRADPTACTVWGVFWHEDRRQVMMLDCWADHLGLPDLIIRVKKELAVFYGDDDSRPMLKPLIGPPRGSGSGRKADILLIEDKGSGISLRQMLDKQGVPSYAYNPGRADKLTRLHMVSHIFARGQVWLPESEHKAGRPKTWIEPFLEQICAFSGSGSTRHDDFVDSATQAVRLLVDKGLLEGRPPDKKGERPAYRPYKPVVNPYAA